MQENELLEIVISTLEDKKGLDIAVIDVKGKTSITDFMIIVTGTSDRHIMALVQYVEDKVKQHQLKPLGVEGEKGSEWVLLDLGDVIVHVMTAQTREFYQLEKLWQVEHSEPNDQAINHS